MMSISPHRGQGRVVVSPEHPEGGPAAGLGVQLDAGLPTVAQLAEQALGLKPGAVVGAVRIGSGNGQVTPAIGAGVGRGTGVDLLLAVAPPAAAEVVLPPGRVRGRAGRAAELVSETVPGQARLAAAQGGRTRAGRARGRREAGRSSRRPRPRRGPAVA